MEKYICLLRGINVSGQKKILMADLKTLFKQLGLHQIYTYLQSGNVLFSVQNTDKAQLQKQIEVAIAQQYGFQVPVQIHSPQVFERIIQAYPFKHINVSENGSKILVSFLSDQPEADKQAQLMAYVIAPEQCLLQGAIVYLFCPNGYGKSKLSNRFLEQKLGVTATTRNWNSIHKLFELSQTSTPQPLKASS